MGVRYPQHLLPNRRYKLITLDEWMHQMYVLRFAEGDIDIPNEDILRESIPLHFKDSRWLEGISVSLCGPFRKMDVGYIIKPYKREKLSRPWKVGKGVRQPKAKHAYINQERGYMGMKIEDVLEVKFPYTLKYKEGTETKERTDECKLVLEHAPTHTNFWHFNIWIESHNTKDDVIFTTESGQKKLPSNNNMKKRAQACFEMLRDIVCMPDQTREIKLPQQYYVR